MNALALLKAAKGGGFGPEQWAEMLSAMGVEVEVSMITETETPEAFQGLAKQTLVRDAKVLAIRGTMKNGDHLDALFVLSSPQKNVLTLVLPSKG